MSFSIGTRNPAIVVARTPVTRPTFKTVSQLIADSSANRSARRQASYAANRLIAIPRGVPMYAVGRGQMARGEVKFFDVAVLPSVISNPYGLPLVASVTGAEPATAFAGLTEINCVPQGATAYNRIGTKIQIKSIKLDGQFHMGGSAPTHNTFRWMLVYDRQPNGAFPLISTILSQNISTAPLFTSGVNMANRSRFVILRDQYVAMDPDSNGLVNVSAFVKTKLETQFSTSSANIGDITTGAIYFIAFAMFSAATSFIANNNIQARIRYYD